MYSMAEVSRVDGLGVGEVFGPFDDGAAVAEEVDFQAGEISRLEPEQERVGAGFAERFPCFSQCLQVEGAGFGRGNLHGVAAAEDERAISPFAA